MNLLIYFMPFAHINELASGYWFLMCPIAFPIADFTSIMIPFSKDVVAIGAIVIGGFYFKVILEKHFKANKIHVYQNAIAAHKKSLKDRKMPCATTELQWPKSDDILTAKSTQIYRACFPSDEELAIQRARNKDVLAFIDSFSKSNPEGRDYKVAEIVRPADLGDSDFFDFLRTKKDVLNEYLESHPNIFNLDQERFLPLNELPGLPAPNFKNAFDQPDPPDWIRKMVVLANVATLKALRCIKTCDYEGIINAIRISTAIRNHVVQLPAWDAYDKYYIGHQPLLVVLKKIAGRTLANKFDSAAAVQIAESVLPIKTPYSQLPALFLHQLDVIQSLPEASDRLKSTGLDPDQVEKAASIANNPTLKARATAQAYATYDFATKLTNLESLTGKLQIEKLTEASLWAADLSPRFDDLYKLSQSKFILKVKLYLTLEARRRMYVILMRILDSNINGVDWQPTLTKDICGLDPYSNTPFEVKLYHDQAVITGTCPSFQSKGGMGKELPIRIVVNRSQNDIEAK